MNTACMSMDMVLGQIVRVKLWIKLRVEPWVNLRVELWMKVRVVLRVIVLERVMRLITLIDIRVEPTTMGLLVGRWRDLCASVLELAMMLSRGNYTIQVLMTKRKIE